MDAWLSPTIFRTRMCLNAAIRVAIIMANISAACWVFTQSGAFAIRNPSSVPHTAAQKAPVCPSNAASVNQVSRGFANSVGGGAGVHGFIAAAMVSAILLRIRAGVNGDEGGPWCSHWYAPAMKGRVPLPGLSAQFSFPKRRRRVSFLYPEVASLVHEMIMDAMYGPPLEMEWEWPSICLPIQMVSAEGVVTDLGLMRYPNWVRSLMISEVCWVRG